MPGPVTDPRAGELLRRYRDTFGGPEIPVPVESIAEDLLGLQIGFRPDLEYSGMLIPSLHQIWVSAMHERELGLRRRFTIAHELGHWICHYLEGKRLEEVYCRPVDVSEAADRDLEREANVFAAELLMPEASVRAAWAEAPDRHQMSWRFEVSEPAMHWRLFNFGLMQDPRTP